jgi:hypothetical protein
MYVHVNVDVHTLTYMHGIVDTRLYSFIIPPFFRMLSDDVKTFVVEMLIVERNCTKNVDGHQRTPSTGTVYVNNVPYQDKLKSVDADTWLQLEVEQIVNAFGNLRVCDVFYSLKRKKRSRICENKYRR